MAAGLTCHLMDSLRTGYRPKSSLFAAWLQAWVVTSWSTSALATHPDSSTSTWLQVAKTLPEQISQYAQVVLQTLAYAGTGDVLQIQSLLAMCGEHTEVDENAAWKVGGLHTDTL